MCGRFTLKTPAAILTEYFGIEPLPGLPPRYNIAPSQPVATVRGSERRYWHELRWGLVPYWAKDTAIGNRMINARAETLAERAAYREPFARRRCLIPADGFYEWRRTASSAKQPYYLHLEDEAPFAFAGLWDRWRDHNGDLAIESCALITTEPNELLAPIHDRMPVILERDAYDTWLDPGSKPDQLRPLLGPYPAARMRARPVSPWVNKPANDDPRCIQQIDRPTAGRTLFD